MPLRCLEERRLLIVAATMSHSASDSHYSSRSEYIAALWGTALPVAELTSLECTGGTASTLTLNGFFQCQYLKCSLRNLSVLWPINNYLQRLQRRNYITIPITSLYCMLLYTHIKVWRYRSEGISHLHYVDYVHRWFVFVFIVKFTLLVCAHSFLSKR